MRFPLVLIGIVSVVIMGGCVSVRAPEPILSPNMSHVDLSGEWEFQDEGAAQRVALDANGNGTYTWQNGHIVTRSVSGPRWEGTWYQEGNDREGGFDVLLSDDAMQAEGTWWYTRIGTRNLPPREQGGSFRFKRLPSAAARPFP